MLTRLAFFVALTFSFSFSQAMDQVMLAGDSWAALPCAFGSAHLAFLKKKMNVGVVCNWTTIVGIKAGNFKQKKPYQSMIKILKKRADIKAVYLSLGGNDLLTKWNKDLTPEEELALFERIKASIVEIIADIHKIKPEMKVLVSGYDFANFMKDHPISGYAKVFRKMHEPTTLEVQSVFVRFADFMADIKTEKVAYIHHYGVMHYHFGVPELGLPPRTTTHPGQISSPGAPKAIGGVLDARNAPKAMMRIDGWITDAFHLSPTGYRLLFEHSIDLYLRDWLASKTQ